MIWASLGHKLPPSWDSISSLGQSNRHSWPWNVVSKSMDQNPFSPNSCLYGYCHSDEKLCLPIHLWHTEWLHRASALKIVFGTIRLFGRPRESYGKLVNCQYIDEQDFSWHLTKLIFLFWKSPVDIVLLFWEGLAIDVWRDDQELPTWEDGRVLYLGVPIGFLLSQLGFPLLWETAWPRHLL